MPHIPDNAHDTHDLELVAAYAAGDAEAAGLERATALVATCTECATLHHDLRAIAAALPEVPAQVRPRDFRLTPEQAASLRPSGIRGLLAAFSGPRFAFATPLGTGLAALGIVGVLVASGGLATGGAAPAERNSGTDGSNETFITQAAPDRELASTAAASAAAGAPAEAPVAVGPAEETPSVGVDTMGGEPVPSAAASAAPVAAEASKAPAAAEAFGPSPSANDQYLANLEASPGASAPTAAAPAPTLLADDGGSVQPAMFVALALVLAGLVLVSLRWVARRAS